MSAKLNAQRTRAVDVVPFGFACYEGEDNASGDEWVGTHVGVLGNAEDALDWLETGQPRPTRIHK